MNIDMGYGISIWDTICRYGKLLYQYGHPGYRYGIWANDMGDDSIDTVISHIDMGYPVTLRLTISAPRVRERLRGGSGVPVHYEQAVSERTQGGGGSGAQEQHEYIVWGRVQGGGGA
jgi:hypothetical protein